MRTDVYDECWCWQKMMTTTMPETWTLLPLTEEDDNNDARRWWQPPFPSLTWTPLPPLPSLPPLLPLATGSLDLAAKNKIINTQLQTLNMYHHIRQKIFSNLPNINKIKDHLRFLSTFSHLRHPASDFPFPHANNTMNCSSQKRRWNQNYSLRLDLFWSIQVCLTNTVNKITCKKILSRASVLTGGFCRLLLRPLTGSCSPWRTKSPAATQRRSLLFSMKSYISLPLVVITF